ncbi:MAG: carboxymuconolactone decarboxylase family protein [Ignavibacteria bacterium]|nr:carboxymuconolactone decarboxylase family protein [Ignavibacteria bacterium]
MSKHSEFHTFRRDMNEKILNCGFNDFKKFFALDTKAYHEGEIPSKYKELMGLTASMVLRCNDCIFYHLDQAIKLGTTKKELYESMNIALIVSGSIVIPHLRYAFSVIDELLEKKNETDLT